MDRAWRYSSEKVVGAAILGYFDCAMTSLYIINFQKAFEVLKFLLERNERKGDIITMSLFLSKFSKLLAAALYDR